ncbi:MAG: hypothetical protein HZB51_12605 [Chloroflexi bacterium]|nr:hypothetical protein [Chloroflexota bacterium]
MSEQKTSWLERLREWFRFSHGDTIIANVGEGARDVIVGKNVIKVGTLVVPAVPVFVGVVILIVLVAIGGYLYFVPNKMPLDTFNIAVADFGVMGADKQIQVTSESQSFSRMIFAALRDELIPLATNQPGLPKPLVWNDSLFPSQIRVQIGMIPGSSPEQQHAAAAARATELGANIIVYGNLETNSIPSNFVPAFYVAPLVGEADEIVGRYQFGSPIPVQLSSQPGSTWFTSLAQDKTLIARRQALAQLTFGLLKDFRGYHEDALGYFQNALKLLQASDNRAGEEVLNYFIGREYLFMANHQQALGESRSAQGDQAGAQDAFAQVEPNLTKAAAAFNAAKNRNATYARAYYGLGGVYQLRMMRQSAPDRLAQPEFMNRAFGEYQTALNHALQAREEQTEIKVRGALASTLFLQGEAYLHQQDWARAADTFDESIKRTNEQLNEIEKNKQVRSMAEAYLTLGNATFEKGIAKSQLNDTAAAKILYDQANSWYAKCWDLRIYDPTIVQGAAARCQRAQTQVNDWISKLP